MGVDVEPPELARLIDFAERLREGDWSLRSALVRYAQPHPARVSTVLDLVRRIEFALHPHAKLIEREGPDVWAAVGSDQDVASEPQDFVVGVLRATTELDQLGDVLAAWAATRTGDGLDAEVDRVATGLAQRLDELGVAREEPRPPRGRRRGAD